MTITQPEALLHQLIGVLSRMVNACLCHQPRDLLPSTNKHQTKMHGMNPLTPTRLCCQTFFRQDDLQMVH